MIKDEVRVLIFDSLADYLIYVIQRGIKGIEHVGMLKGNFEDLLNHLISTELIKETRYIYSPDGKLFKVLTHGDIKIYELSPEELSPLINIISEGRRVIGLVKDELKLIMIQK
ncbi:MAG: hypothetical protein QXO98_04490 [Sulfolobales archaeon]